MYKCLDCGNIFEEGEQAIYREHHGFSGGPCEEFHRCPICGGEIEVTHKCVDCDGEFLEDELICGYCMECLKESVTFEKFLDFATTCGESADEAGILEDFVLRVIYKVNGHDEILTCSSDEFKEACKVAYNKAVDKDMKHKWLIGSGDMLNAIIDYIGDSCLWYEFAEYLETKERWEGE